MVILVLASLLPLIAPLPMMAMAVFTSFLQAYVFVMLSTLYLAGAMAEAYYKGLPSSILEKAWSKIPQSFQNIVVEFAAKYGSPELPSKGLQ